MKYFPQDIIENEEKFLEAFKTLDNDKDKKQVLVQYYLTNGNLPESILHDFYSMWCIETGMEQPEELAGEFDAKIDDVYFKIHYNRQSMLYLDVVCTFKKDNTPSEKEIYLNEKIDELADYEDIFPSRLISELRECVRRKLR